MIDMLIQSYYSVTNSDTHTDCQLYLSMIYGYLVSCFHLQ